MIVQIADKLQERGYRLLNEEVNGLFYREADEAVYAITLSYEAWIDDAKEYRSIEKRMEFMLSARFQKRVQCLHIVLTENGMFEEGAQKLLEQFENLWLVAMDTGRLYVFERQIVDFDGLRDALEQALKRQPRRDRVKNVLQTAPVTSSIVLLNIVYFFVVILVNKSILAVSDASIMMKMGAQSYETVTSGEWYRLFTSMFLHFGFEHLINNMLLLGFIGYELERRIGRIPYVVLYFFSGVMGNVVSHFYYRYAMIQVVSAGASGAIYGVLGALLVTLLICKTHRAELSPNRIVLMIVLTIYHGITSTGVDNAAHIGGLVTGILVGFLLSKISQYGKLEEVNFMR